MKSTNQSFSGSEESLIEAKKWENRIIENGFYRELFFQKILKEITLLSDIPLSILEVGSGPGHLAERIMESIKVEKYALFDLSESMNYIASQRLKNYQDVLNINVGDFLNTTDYDHFNNVDVVVCMQTIHEAGDKKLAADIYKCIRTTLKPAGVFLVCDFIYNEESMDNSTMYMTATEQKETLLNSGFKSPELVSLNNGLTLYKAYN
jgi:SAM-dependent methyltransferase